MSKRELPISAVVILSLAVFSALLMLVIPHIVAL